MQDRLSDAAREVMRLALAESEQLGHGYLGDGALRQAYHVDTARLRTELDHMSS